MSKSLDIQLHSGELPSAVVLSAGKIMRECFSEGDAEEDFAERVHEKRNPLLVLALKSGQPVGFKLGFEQSRGVFTSWLGGTVPECHRQGIATAMLRAQHHWVEQNGYHTLFTESANRFKGMVILNLLEGFQIVGTRWNTRRQSLGILFAKQFGESSKDA